MALGKADQLVVRVLSRTPHFDPTLRSFFGSLARYLILTVTLLAVLSRIGIQTTSLVGVIGAASLAVGLALQGTLSNLAAGIMLLNFRPFRVGHKCKSAAASARSRSCRCSGPSGDRRQGADHRADGGRLGEPLATSRLLSAPPHARRGSFRDRGGVELEPAIEKVLAPSSKPIRAAHRPRSERAARSQRRRMALEIVVAFSTAEDETAAVKSDLIKGVDAALYAEHDRREGPSVGTVD